MSRHTARALPLFLVVLFIGFNGLLVWATDPPDSEVNPENSYIETVDATLATNQYDIRHVSDPGGGLGRDISTVSDSSLDDLSPRLAISDDGDTWVTWYRDDAKDKVFLRKRTYPGGTWDDERLVSEKTENSWRPEIVHDGTLIWVAFEFEETGGTGIGVNGIMDDPNPIGARISLRTTGYTGDVAVMIHAESTHLWVTWVDSDDDVGWSEYDYSSETWALSDYESYATDSVGDARGRIRGDVIGE